MNVQVLRFWGIVVGAALIAVALWIAALGPETAPAQTLRATPQGAQSEAQSHFLVRFRGAGPMARAQVAPREGASPRRKPGLKPNCAASVRSPACASIASRPARPRSCCAPAIP